MKVFESNKLYYDKFFYKIDIRNGLAHLFREKKFHIARRTLDYLQQCYDNNSPLTINFGLRQTPISTSDFIDAKKLYNIFLNFNDYKLRVEKNVFSIYTNDMDWIELIQRSISVGAVYSFYRPEEKYKSLLDSNTILVNNDTGYQYKVTISNTTRLGNPSFAKWAEANPKLVKLGPVLKESMLNQNYVSGMYFYVRDSKVMELCSLMLGDLGRIDKLVVKS